MYYSPSNAPHTPLVRKTRRLGTQKSPGFDLEADSPVHDRTMLSLPPDSIHDTDDFPTTSIFPALAGGSGPGPSPGRLDRSMQLLEAESHAVRLSLQEKEQGDKGTSKSYARQVASYLSWWDDSQAAKVLKNPLLRPIPAFPPTVAKVCMFLQYEASREKKKRGTTETIAGSSVGKSQISQVISALESHRVNFQHQYKSCPEAQVPLRSDKRIRQFESSAKHDEPKRAEKAQITKAAGSSSARFGNITATWCWTFPGAVVEVLGGSAPGYSA
ncbi:hypothetical protein B0H11DRAFT_2436563 [Mycena galericulata]|nr:hypothetical protein B0H11DRAFT_2436563 [Mycena galericulata]